VVSIRDVIESLTELELDESRVAHVTGLTLERDVGRFTLAEGDIIFAQPIQGRVFAAVFVGEGTADFATPIEVERQSMERFIDRPTLEAEPFRTLVLFFGDQTEAELVAGLTFGPGDEPKDASREAEEAIKFLTSEEDGVFDIDVLRTVLNDEENSLFYAHFAESRGDPFIFMVNPYTEEEISLSMKRERIRFKARDAMAVFHTQEELAAANGRAPDVPTEDASSVTLDNYRIDSTMEENLRFSATTTFDITPRESGAGWVPLTLFAELDVRAVTGPNGAAVPFHRVEEQAPFWVHLGDAPAGQPVTLTMQYDGELLEPAQFFNGPTPPGFRTLLVVRSSAGWYPKVGGRERASFDLTFTTPEKYRHASAGQKLSEEVIETQRVSRWTLDSGRNAGFNFGEFQEFPIAYPGIPDVVLQVAVGFHEDIRSVAGLSTQGDVVRQVQGDVQQAFGQYQLLFGPSPVESFYITEIPGSHGEAFPGLVHLMWQTYQQSDEKGDAEWFRGHEVAHQWWGIGVDFDSYRDQWLSEGFSSFAALWFVEKQLNLQEPGLGDENYHRKLDDFADLIRDADEAGAVWLGFRNATVNHPENRQIITYYKGAWVMHMLRELTKDLELDADFEFETLIKEFYSRHAGGSASTADLQAVTEEVLGRDMGWFFDQWVYGSAIPKYKYASQSEQVAGGQYKVSLRVRQEDVPDDFQMDVPVRVTLKDGSVVMTRVHVAGPETIIELPLMAAEPDEVEFNYGNAVLAEVDREGW